MKTTEEQIKDINKGNLKNSPFFICPYRDTLNIWIKIIGDRLERGENVMLKLYLYRRK